jgi:hypothetical protein
MTVESAYRAIVGPGNITETYSALHETYKLQLRGGAAKILKEYEKSLKGFYPNAHANLKIATQKLFELGVEGDELIAQLKNYLKKYANRYNPSINWQLFMFKSESPTPVWCLNCFMFSH